MKKHEYVFFALFLAGCIDSRNVAGAVVPMCEEALDCDTANGEVCAEGVCWGNPPAQAYAALLVPPPREASELVPLVATELPRLEIRADGTIENLRFAEPVTWRGRVVLACRNEVGLPACSSDRSIAAQIQVKRPSRIPGGQPYILHGSSQAGVEGDRASFALALPPSEPGERYEVTIVPSIETDPTNSVSPAEMAPPVRFHVEATEKQSDLLWTVGDPLQHVLVSGRVVDAVGGGISGRRVSAMPHSDEVAILDRQSSLGTTDDDGRFTLRINRDMSVGSTIDILVEPKESGTAPILRVSDIALPVVESPDVGDDIPGDGGDAVLPGDGGEDILDDVIDLGDLKMPVYSELRTFTLPVLGIDGGGENVPIPAADVRITTYLSGADSNTTAIFSNQTFTNDDGNAQIDLIPGSEVENRRYLVRVGPPPDAEYASVYDHEIDVGSTQGGVLAPVVLARRVPVTGTLLTQEGSPAVGTTVAATLAVGFRWNLNPSSRALVDTLQLPEDVTDQNGHFVVWLEESLLGSVASYDLSLRPVEQLAPRWSLHDIDMTQRDEIGTVNLGMMQFPGAAYVRGTVRAPDGEPVSGAEVRLYALSEDQTLCTTTSWPGDGDAECLVPPRYRGPTHSRSDGQVTLVLPKPPM